jgi:hypothetical protein
MNVDGSGQTRLTSNNADDYYSRWQTLYLTSTTVYTVDWEEHSFNVTTLSNSTISDLTFNQPEKHLSFNVTVPYFMDGFCNITIPSALMSGDFSIYKNDILLIENVDYIETNNDTHHIFSITYEYDTQRIEIFSTIVIPELTSTIMIATLIVTTIAVVIYGKRSSKKRKNSSTRCARNLFLFCASNFDAKRISTQQQNYRSAPKG